MRLKKHLSIALLICFLTPLFLKVGVCVNYVVQYKYYVEVLCKNKNKPEYKCNGKCHLAKELINIDEDPVKPEFPQKLKDKKEDVFLKNDWFVFAYFKVIQNENIYTIFNPPFLKICFSKP